MKGVCVALRGPGAGLKRAGPSIGIWMKVVPGGCRSARGLAATVERVGGVKVVWRKLAVRFLANCFCRTSLVWEREKKEGERQNESLWYHKAIFDGAVLTPKWLLKTEMALSFDSFIIFTNESTSMHVRSTLRSAAEALKVIAAK